MPAPQMLRVVEGPAAWLPSVAGCVTLGQALPLSGLPFPPLKQDISDSQRSPGLGQGGPEDGLVSE